MAQPLDILARDYVFSVSVSGVSYTTISGINNWAPKYDKNMEDATVFADQGATRELGTSYKVVFTLEGEYYEDLSDGTRDAGQAAVDASIGQFGVAGLRYYKITHTGVAGDVLIFKAAAKPTKYLEGGNDSLAPWGVELSMYGNPVTASGAWANLFPVTNP